MGPCGLPSPPVAQGAAELKQLYVLSPWKGTGIAQALMDWVIATARADGASHLVLSVYSDNHRAQRFYARYGMAEIGSNLFMVGEQADDDRIYCVAL
jgi:ribosomal protein S18 acetylase RimI-like enzyme